MTYFLTATSSGIKSLAHLTLSLIYRVVFEFSGQLISTTYSLTIDSFVGVSKVNIRVFLLFAI